MPTAAQARASRVTRPAMSLPRRVRRASQRSGGTSRWLPGRVARPAIRAPGARSSACRLQHVADAADGVDQRLTVGVDLLAQVTDVQLDHMGLAAEVVVPHPV